jgi:uncharacterized protein YgiM (DUF1202 family)
MKKHKGIIFLFNILVITALACNLPSAQPTATPSPVDSGGYVNVDATLTFVALTQAALGQNQPPTQPESTATITMTPTITPTGTPSIPMVSVSLDTNCRTGPGVVYDYLTALLVGEKAEVVGKYTTVSPNYWIIKKGSYTCWLWGKYATVEGDISKLPEMVPPPSPTPTSTNTPTQVPGDLSIVDFWMSGSFKIVIRVKTSPANSLSGTYQYTIYSNGSQVEQGNCTVPANEDACNTNYAVSGTESIQVVIDSANSITEGNEGNNSMTKNCDKFGLTCN